MSESNLDVVNTFFETAAREGLESAATKCCAQNYTWWVAGIGDMRAKVAQMSKLMQQELDENGLAMKLLGFTCDGERVAVESESYGRLKRGTRYNNHYHFLFIVRNGRIEAIREYNDTAHAAEVWSTAMAERGLA